MKFTLLYMIVTIALFSTVKGQEKTVTLDYLHNELNNNQPLPAQEYFVVRAAVSPEVSMIRLSILKDNRRADTLYSTLWRRPVGNTSGDLAIPVRYKLRGNDHYHLSVTYYTTPGDSGRVRFARAVRANLEAYVESAFDVGGTRMSLRTPVARMRSDMNQIVYNAFTYYKNGLFGSFPGFSDLIKNKLTQIRDARLRHARYNVPGSAGDNTAELRQRYASRLQQQLIDACMGEVMPFINDHLVVVQDTRDYTDFPTEQTRNTLAVNVGYGAVYLSGGWHDLSYDDAPYLGLSFPLGNRHFNRFMGNTSVSAGIFLHDFRDENDQKITGPVVGKPLYLGLGYRVLRFVRLNAGLVATAREKSTLQHIRFQDVKLRPFVGMSAEINLWLGAGDR
jgi:hypothetical protein